MFNKSLVVSILQQISDALGDIETGTRHVNDWRFFTDSPEGKEKLAGVCMLFAAVGEALKQIDKITSGTIFLNHPEIDWKGAMSFRDVIVHHYFDIDAEEVFWICKKELAPLSQTIKKIIENLR